jgi:NADH-quinone oxidoreductase subunit L
VVTLPLILLAIPSIFIGMFTAGPMLFAKGWNGAGERLPFFLGSIQMPEEGVMAKLAEEFHGAIAFALHGLYAPAFLLVIAGFALATFLYVIRPDMPAKVAHALRWPIRVLERKYFMDDLWIDGFAGGGVALGQVSRQVDSKVIDGVFVNGSARVVDLVSGVVRQVQSGYLYHYAFAMIIGLIALLAVIYKLWI